MQAVVDRVQGAIIDAFTHPGSNSDVSRPLLVSIAGAPGSGKSTLVSRVAAQINATADAMRATSKPSNNNGDDEATGAVSVEIGRCYAMGMDGYHYYRHELAAMDNADEALRLRGAYWTFDAMKLLHDMRRLRDTGRLVAPAFEHALKDPTPDAIRIDATTSMTAAVGGDDAAAAADAVPTPAPGAVLRRSIVLVEGLYVGVLRATDEWQEISDLFDLKVFLRVDMDVATERLTQRHMAAWGIPREEAWARASGSDRANGVLVTEHAGNCDVVVDSVDDAEYAAA